MRYISLILLASAVGLSAQTTGTIRGFVRLASNKTPLHHATVRLTPSNRSVQTGEDGEYEFSGVPAGSYEVVAHVHALTDEKQTVNLVAGQAATADFSLKLASVKQEITVTASGREESTLETFQSVTSLDNYELTTKATAPSLGELLDQQPGIAKRSYGPGTSRPVIRGFDGDRVLVMQDGARTGTLSSQSGDHGEPVEATELERVEVVRGPATLLYGSSAIGGVVNVITRHHELDEHPHAGLHGGLTALAGTTNASAGGSANLEFGLGNYLFWASGGGQRSGDYHTPIGEIQNSFSNIRQTSAGVGRYGEKRFFTFEYGLQDGAYGIPVPAAGAGLETNETHLDWRRHNFRFHGGYRNLTGWLESFRLTANYSDWNHKEIEESTVGTEFFNKQFTAQGMFQQKRIGPFSGTFGAWTLVRDFNAKGDEALAPPVRQNAAAGFGMEELQFEHFKLQLGGRLENTRYDARPPENYNRAVPDRSFTGLSGAAGILVPLPGSAAVVVNYTTSYRAPALEELYNFGPHLGNLAFEIGNTRLARERGQGIELSLKQHSTRLRTEINLYRYWINNFVYLAPTGAITEGLIEANYDQANSRYLGAEARVDMSLLQSLWLNLGFDAVDAQIQQTRLPLPRIPPVRGRIGLDYHRSGFTVRPELILSNRQWQVFPTETPTAGYAAVNVLGSYVIGRQHVSHLFSANLFNATDQLYRNHLSFIKEFAPEIGRGVRFSYTVNFY